MANPAETVTTLPAGTTVNIGGHEDGDSFQLTQNLEVRVVGPVQREGLPVIVKEIDPDQILFLHQPEPNQRTVKK